MIIPIFDKWNSGFDRFLKFAKTKEDGSFKIIPRAGIEIYDKDNNEKIADIYGRGRTKVNLYLRAETGFGSIRKLLKSEKLERAKEIYNRLKREYKEWQLKKK